MTTLYKLTDCNRYTRDDTRWGEFITHSVPKQNKGVKLCTNQVIHAYEHPVVAVLMNPVHADLMGPRLWVAKGKIVNRDGDLKCGVKKLITLQQIPLPTLTQTEQLEIVVRCVLARYRKKSLVTWARSWLDGTDRSQKAALRCVNDIVSTMHEVSMIPRMIMEPNAYNVHFQLAQAIQAISRAGKRPLNLIKIIEKVRKGPGRVLTVADCGKLRRVRVLDSTNDWSLIGEATIRQVTKTYCKIQYRGFDVAIRYPLTDVWCVR